MQKAVVQQGGRTIVWLFLLFMRINFVDKAVIGLAAVPMKEIGPHAEGIRADRFKLFLSVLTVGHRAEPEWPGPQPWFRPL